MERDQRESKKQFWERIDREGRREEVEAMQEELLSEGDPKRLVQECLVELFQPIDGTRTRAWQTPDSWENGRCHWRKPPIDKQEQEELDLVWVHENQDAKLDDAPTPGAKLILRIAQQRPAEFYRHYSKCLPRIVERQNGVLLARTDGIAERREAVFKAIEAEKRAIAKEESRKQAEAARQAAAQEEARRAEQQKQKEARRRVDAEKQAADQDNRRDQAREQERLQIEVKPSGVNGHQQSLADSSKDIWGVV
jgi:hypothetical protein